MNIKIKFAGIGGQGIQFAGKLLGEAGFKGKLNVSQGVVYEPATTGGLTVADVTLAPRNQEILYPFIEEPDILVVFAQRAWDEFQHTVSENTIILADKDNVQNFDGPQAEKAKFAFHLPFSSMARELGAENVTNVIIIGFISEMLDLGDNYVPAMIHETHPEEAEEYELLEVAPENFEESLIKSSPAKFKELNLKAFHKGYQLSIDTEYTKEFVIH